MDQTTKQELEAKIRRLIAKAVKTAKGREDAERAAGKVLMDNPVARIMRRIDWAVSAAVEIPPETRWAEPINFGAVPAMLLTGQTSYLTMRRMRGAYAPALALLAEQEEPCEEMLYPLFHYVPGALGFIVWKEHLLLHVRSSRVAGTFSGMVSAPGGLMKPGETVMQCACREVAEETGIHGGLYRSRGAWVRNSAAPSTTFCLGFEIEVSHRHRAPVLVETYEAEGRKNFWVPIQECVKPALDGQTKALVAFFRDQGLEVPDALDFAPDAKAGMIGLGFGA